MLHQKQVFKKNEYCHARHNNLGEREGLGAQRVKCPTASSKFRLWKIISCAYYQINHFLDSPIEFFMIGISVRLSDRSLHHEEQKKFIKNCPQWSWKPGPPDLEANALPTELGRNLLGRRFLKRALFVSCTTSHVGLC